MNMIDKQRDRWALLVVDNLPILSSLFNELLIEFNQQQSLIPDIGK